MSESLPSRIARRRHALLILLLLLALALRLGWGLSRPAQITDAQALGDQGGYLELSRNLIAGRGLQLFDPRFGQTVYAMRLPGYPLFLAALGSNARAARVAQALLDVSTVLAIYLLARRWLCGDETTSDCADQGAATARERNKGQQTARSPAVAVSPERGARRVAPLIASALVAFNPFLVYFSALILTETLFTAMLAWALVLFSYRRTMMLGILFMALSVHVRPSAVALPMLLGAAAGWLHAGHARGRRAVGAGLIGIVLTALALFPWAHRNHRVLGAWIWFSSNDGITAYDGFHPAAAGGSDQSFTRRMPELAAMTELQRNDYLAAAARRLIAEQPGRAARLTLRKIARTWSPVPLSADYGSRLYAAAGLLFSLPFYALILIGLSRGGLKWSVLALIVLPALYFTAVHALSVGSLRYRVPAEPPLAILAAAGACAFASRARKKPGERHLG